MKTEDRIEKLKKALQYLTEVRDGFSDEEKCCNHCGVATFVNWNEKQMRDQINGSISRLEKVISRLKRS